jgi:hypothetical protein
MPRLVPALTSYHSARAPGRPYWPDPGGNRGPHPKYGPTPMAELGEYTLSSGGLLLAAAAIGAYFLFRKKGS